MAQNKYMAQSLYDEQKTVKKASSSRPSERSGAASDPKLRSEFQRYKRDTEIELEELRRRGGAAPSAGTPGVPGKDGKDGVGIQSITQEVVSEESGGENVVSVKLTDSSSYRFTVRNGKQGGRGDPGSPGTDGIDGKDGVSPVVNVSKVGKETTITVTDAQGTKTATILDGEDGGEGSSGTDGKDGVGISSIVQTVKSTEDDGINVVTVTLTDGSVHTFEVQNGSKGSDGKDGVDGKTPVRGTDFWTDSDIASIKSYLETVILNGEW